MADKNQIAHYLKIFLWLIALHSFLVGIALITAPSQLFSYFGFAEVTEKFFPVQAGVFHIILSIAYAMAAIDVFNQGRMVMLTISAKLIATVFLVTYYFLIMKIWMVIVSAIGDAFMGFTVWHLYSRFLKCQDR